MRSSWCAWVGLAALALAPVAVAVADAPATSSLPSVESGARPGPDVLYAPPPRAPHLENTGVWRAAPLLVSGASAYRDGEFLYQDFLYDDHGATGVPDEDGTTFAADYLFAPAQGTYSYPTDPVFAHNAADLVELRVRPLADATAFRVTLNTMLDPERVAFTIALGESPAPVPWPARAGVRSPAERFLTVHGSTGELVSASAPGVALEPAPSVDVDRERRQVTVTVPHAAWDPGTGTVRIAAGVGLWDRDASTYLVPGARASATRPGGVPGGGAALVNLAFRASEPLPEADTYSLGFTMGDAAVTAKLDSRWWRERAQADALLSGDVGPFAVHVDFSKLLAEVRDDTGVPTSGVLNRIFTSRYELGDGVDPEQKCPRWPVTCRGHMVGPLQQYALYVPDRARPDRGWGLTLLLHALSANYNMYSGSRYAPQLGDRGAGSLVLTPGSRGPDGDYNDYTEGDAFEAWADVARHYAIDPDWTAVAGYSMGGGGTFKLAQRWPDLFGAGWAAAVAARFEDTQRGQWLDGLRHVPVLNWVGIADEGSTPVQSRNAIAAMTDAGLEFAFDLFHESDHLTIFENDEFGPAAEFLGERRVVRDPSRVSYVRYPARDYPAAGVVADHAYWLSGLVVRDTARSPIARVDARSAGHGLSDPEPLGTRTTTRVLTGGRKGPMTYDRSEQLRAPAVQVAAEDVLTVDAENLAAMTVDVRRARLSCGARIDITTDGPLTVTLAGCGRSVSAP